MTRLGPCPLCDDEGPWENAAARVTHIRAHHTVDCDLCGAPVNTSGLDAHMRYVHPDVDEPAAPPEPVDQDPEPDTPAPDPEPAAPAPDLVDDPAPEPVDVVHPDDEPEVPAPELVEEPAPAPELSCSTCGKVGFADARGLAAHRRSHEIVTCPDCGQEVKANGLGPHKRSHRQPDRAPAPGARLPAAQPAPTPAPVARIDPNAEVDCPDCGTWVKGRGLGRHRAMHRRAAELAKAAPPAPSTLPAALAELIPGAATDLLARLTEFIEQAKEPPAPGLWIVAPLTGARPWLCRAAAVGHVVAREHTAAVVVSVDDIRALLNPHARREAS